MSQSNIPHENNNPEHPIVVGAVAVAIRDIHRSGDFLFTEIGPIIPAGQTGVVLGLPNNNLVRCYFGDHFGEKFVDAKSISVIEMPEEDITAEYIGSELVDIIADLYGQIADLKQEIIEKDEALELANAQLVDATRAPYRLHTDYTNKNGSQQ